MPDAPALPGTDPDPGPPRELADGPLLQFSAEGHYFGRMEKNERRSHTAIFYNAGSEPIEITRVNTHCGCAAALLSAKKIPPGGRGTLAVTMSSGTLPGKRVKTVEIITDPPIQPVTTYVISCDVIADVSLDPIALVVRATRSAGPINAHFDILSIRPGFDLEVLDVQTNRDDLLAEVRPLPEGDRRSGYRVHLSFGESFKSGDFHERVTVTTNSVRDPRLTVMVLGSLREAVLVVPERIYFPRLKTGDAVSRKIYVYRTDGKPLEVTGVDDTSGMFDIETSRVNPEKWEVVVTVTGEVPLNTVRGSIVIRTDETNESRIAVPFELPGEDL